jgi:hypothetical protein
MEDALLRTIARLDGTPFPSSARLAAGWLRSRGVVTWRSQLRRREPAEEPDPGADEAGLETAFCAQVVAVTYESMGLLPAGRHPSWYDPGRFWSGDDLELAAGAQLGGELEVSVP